MEFRIKPFKPNLKFKCEIVTPTSMIPVNDRTNPDDMKPQRFTLSPIKKSGAIETIDLSENHDDEDLGILRRIFSHHLHSYHKTSNTPCGARVEFFFSPLGAGTNQGRVQFKDGYYIISTIFSFRFLMYKVPLCGQICNLRSFTRCVSRFNP